MKIRPILILSIICLSFPYTALSQTKDQATIGPEMATVYNSMRIVNARAVGGPYRPGDVVTVAYEIKNTTETDLSIPENTTYSQPFFLIGSRQHWIKRNGQEFTITAIPPKIARSGVRYAMGGTIIPTKNTIIGGEFLAFQQNIKTQGYPVGEYTFYIDYKTLEGKVLQSEELTFTLNEI